MPLKLKLRANERLIVNGAVLVNGAYRTTLLVRNYAHIMREKDVLQLTDANTPTKRLYFLIQAMLVQPPPSDELMDNYRLAHRQLLNAFVSRSDIEVLEAVGRFVDATDYYKALARLHPLIDREAQLLNMLPHQWKRASAAPPAGSRFDTEAPPNGPHCERPLVCVP